MLLNKSAEQFNRQAAHYDAQWNKWNEENLRWLVERGRDSANRVLDVATGAGFTALAFAPTAKSVHAVDVSTGMLAQASANAIGFSNVSFQEAPAERLPFSAASFDLVTCRIAAHHFQSVPQFLSEAHRVLSPRGRLLIADTCVPDGGGELDLWQNEVELLRDPSHIRNYSPSEWRTSLEAAGFETVEISSQEGAVPITFVDWLKKSGCTGAPAGRLREMFEQAAGELKSVYRIQPAEGGDLSFAWMRVLINAVKR